MVPNDSKFKTWNEVIAAFKKDPKSVKIAGGSVKGGMDHLVPALTHETKAAERKAVLDGFRAGDYRVVVTSRVLNEGVDVPEAKATITAWLEAKGLRENTLVIFFSDNGGSNIFGGVNTPLRGQKGQTFEGGMRVPAVIRWPARLDGGGVITHSELVKEVTEEPDYAAALAAARAASVAPETAIPASAFFKAGASLTPSPVIPTM